MCFGYPPQAFSMNLTREFSFSRTYIYAQVPRRNPLSGAWRERFFEKPLAQIWQKAAMHLQVRPNLSVYG